MSLRRSHILLRCLHVILSLLPVNRGRKGCATHVWGATHLGLAQHPQNELFGGPCGNQSGVRVPSQRRGPIARGTGLAVGPQPLPSECHRGPLPKSNTVMAMKPHSFGTGLFSKFSMSSCRCVLSSSASSEDPVFAAAGLSSTYLSFASCVPAARKLQLQFSTGTCV